MNAVHVTVALAAPAPGRLTLTLQAARALVSADLTPQRARELAAALSAYADNAAPRCPYCNGLDPAPETHYSAGRCPAERT